MRNGRKTIISLLLTILFIGYWCCTTLFLHEHYIDGVRIVHSHPYTGAPASHSHSGSQLQAISFMSMIVAVVSLSGITTAALTWLRLHRVQSDEKLSTLAQSSLRQLRAPPVC